jgi:hypothetical protein
MMEEGHVAYVDGRLDTSKIQMQTKKKMLKLNGKEEIGTRRSQKAIKGLQGHGWKNS